MRMCWVGAVCLAIGGQVAHAQQANTIIVMDGSGSMWGQIDDRPKLEIARQTLAEVLVDFPAERGLGLLAYGHRRKGDCSDIELLVPCGTRDGITVAFKCQRHAFSRQDASD